MIEIVIYGLIAFIVLVAGTFLFDKIQLKIKQEREYKIANAAEEAQLREQRIARDLQRRTVQSNPKPTTKMPGPISKTKISRSTVNSKTMTAQELHDLFLSKTTSIGKETDATLDEAMKDLDKAMADMDKIFNNNFFKKKK